MIEHHGPEFDPRTESMREAGGQVRAKPRTTAQAGQNRIEVIIASLTAIHHAAFEIARRLEAQADAVLGCSPEADEREPATLVRTDAPLFDRLEAVTSALEHTMRRLDAQAGRNCWAVPAEPYDRSDPLARRGRDVGNGGM